MSVSRITGIVPNLHGPVEIVLATAHYPDKTIENCSEDNLIYLCQLCHSRTDAQDRADNRRSREQAERRHSAERRLFANQGAEHAEDSTGSGTG